MMSKCRALVPIWLCTWMSIGAAAAETPGGYAQALALFKDGDFLAAAAAAAALDTADGYALAARASSAYGNFGLDGGPHLPSFVDAERFARMALARDPAHDEGALQIVVAMGYLSRSQSLLAAIFSGDAEETRELIDAVLARSPDNAFAHALLGAWHAEIIGRAGRVFARTTYGATAEEALASLARALELRPQNVLMHSEYAKALLRLDATRHADEARRHFTIVTDLDAEDSFQRLVQQDAARRLTLPDLGAGEDF